MKKYQYSRDLLSKLNDTMKAQGTVVYKNSLEAQNCIPYQQILLSPASHVHICLLLESCL